jgi:predicted amidohydrolase
VAGSIPERVPGQERLSNTSLLIDPDGEIAATYRKIHMFDVDVGGVAYRESAHEQAGEDIVSAEVDGVRIGLTICYDLRFPELFRVLVDDGARLLTVPACFTVATGRDHWEVLLRARAIENQCYVIAAGQWGEPGGMPSYGRSLVIDPWGLVLAQAPDEDGIALAELDAERQDGIRERLPALAHRRPVVYARTSQSA